MANDPIIQTTGTVSGAGIPGFSRQNLVIGETIDVSDTLVENAGESHLYTFLNVPEGSGLTVLTDPTDEVAIFIPDVTGSYFIECRVNDVFSSQLIFAVTLVGTVARIPALDEETGDYNEGGNIRSYHPAMTKFMRETDALLVAGGFLDINAKVSANDTTTGFLEDQLVAGTVSLLKQNPTANENLQLNLGPLSKAQLSAAVSDGTPLYVGDALPVQNPTTTLATATGDTTTTSAVDVLVDSMTLTPAAGTYLVWFTGAVDHSTTDTTTEMSIYAGGVQDTASERPVTRGGGQGNVTVPFTCMAEVTVDGAEAIEGQWRTTAATATMHERTLVIMEVTP